MSDQQHQSPPNHDRASQSVNGARPEAREPQNPRTDVAPEAGETATTPSLADTSGTGTIIALGCIGGTLFIIVIGLVYLVISQVFG